MGQMAFFIAFLKTSGLFDTLVASCPLHDSSPNAPSKRDVLAPRCSRCCPATAVTLT